ncbi:MAG: DNA polymerase III subunit delta' [Actinobacteria bacterium]|nr:DNA polymerase III subunit delta' [Actinomycetota bacterium]
MSDVFSQLVGQDHAVALLRAAAAEAPSVRAGQRAQAMTHAWLITGPPGSGRSTAALAFAAALVCPQGGCGVCQECVAVRHSAHVDVEHVVPESVTYAVDETRELVRRAAISPSRSPWHVFVLEDADRLNAESANTLLKSIEEPTPGTVWILCAPSTEDVLSTIRSRCRHLMLATPTTAEVAQALVDALGVEPAMASFAARAAQGHIGRARALATDEDARLRRQEVLRIPSQLRDIGSCLALAADLVATVNDDASSICDPLDEQEMAALRAAYGEGSEGRGIGTVERRAKGALKALEDRQKRRRRRVVRDQLDRAIVDLIAFYRDVLVVQLGAASPLVNDEMRPQVERVAADSSPEDTLRRVDALERTRHLLEANVAPLLAVESLTVSLRDPSLAQ